MGRVQRRVGYGVGIGVNAILLAIVFGVDDWGRLPLLDADFERLVPLLGFSLTASILANIAYLAFDDPVVHSLGEIGIGAIGLYVTLRIYRVFPFDVATGWPTLAIRVLLVVAMAGTAIGMITQIGKLASGRAHSTKEASDARGI